MLKGFFMIDKDKLDNSIFYICESDEDPNWYFINNYDYFDYDNATKTLNIDKDLIDGKSLGCIRVINNKTYVFMPPVIINNIEVLNLLSKKYQFDINEVIVIRDYSLIKGMRSLVHQRID